MSTPVKPEPPTTPDVRMKQNQTAPANPRVRRFDVSNPPPFNSPTTPIENMNKLIRELNNLPNIKLNAETNNQIVIVKDTNIPDYIDKIKSALKSISDVIAPNDNTINQLIGKIENKPPIGIDLKEWGKSLKNDINVIKAVFNNFAAIVNTGNFQPATNGGNIRGNTGGNAAAEPDVKILSREEYLNERERSKKLIDEQVRLKNLGDKNPIVKLAYAVAGYMNRKNVGSFLESRTVKLKEGDREVNKEEFWLTPQLFSAFNESMSDVRRMINPRFKMKREFIDNMSTFEHLASKSEDILIYIANYSALILSDRLYGQNIGKETVFNIQNKKEAKDKIILDIMMALDQQKLLRVDLARRFGTDGL